MKSSTIYIRPLLFIVTFFALKIDKVSTMRKESLFIKYTVFCKLWNFSLSGSRIIKLFSGEKPVDHIQPSIWIRRKKFFVFQTEQEGKEAKRISHLFVTKMGLESLLIVLYYIWMYIISFWQGNKLKNLKLQELYKRHKF